jgi:hypothetical protein
VFSDFIDDRTEMRAVPKDNHSPVYLVGLNFRFELTKLIVDLAIPVLSVLAT